MAKKEKLNGSFSAEKTKLKIEYVKINKLKSYEKNAKIHSDKQVAKLVQSIKQFGMNTPLLIDSNFTIVAGHALSLIYTEKIIFNQFADTHTMLLEKYGCKNISLYPINNKPWHTSHYSIPFIPFEPKVKLNIDNFDEVKSLLSKYMDILKNLDKDDYKRVSLDFYMDAIDKIDAAQITYSIISIEALFNVSHSDIQKTVIQRGLKILQNFYPQEYWEKIESDLKIAYDIRSDYAHGERRRTKKANWVLSARILEYARIILSVFLQLSFIVEVERKKIKEKKYINNYLIEKSLLYPDINSRFCEILNNLQIYVKDFDEIGNSYINILEDNSNSKEQIPKTIIDVIIFSIFNHYIKIE